MKFNMNLILIKINFYFGPNQNRIIFSQNKSLFNFNSNKIGSIFDLKRKRITSYKNRISLISDESQICLIFDQNRNLSIFY